MRTYHGAEIKVSDSTGLDMIFTVEMWTEGNHGSVYNTFGGIFDGTKYQAAKAYKAEIDKTIENARRYNMTVEVTDK